MGKIIYNPYLPNYEYVPDGEPHVFGDRLYIYGSHDRFGGSRYCEKDYVCYSAPISDLSSWTYHGVIYKQGDDPDNHGRLTELWAPDVCLGKDGRYYLYYCVAWSAWIGVAFSDKPEGPFTYLGKVKYPDGSLYGSKKGDMPFDPAIFVDEEGKNYLYTAFAGGGFKRALLMKLAFHVSITGKCSYVLELGDDMLTIKSNKPLIPGIKTSKGTSFEGHEFFEASSIRKFDGIYYFIYSSIASHELCYATSSYPDRGFVYRGVLHSNGNIGYKGEREANYPWGNNHGSIVKIGEDYYVFGHRQTNYCEYCRQGVAEKLVKDKQGNFLQSEMTSFGLSKEDPKPNGIFPSSIACILNRDGKASKVNQIEDKENTPMITQKNPDGSLEESQYITNLTNGSQIGYRYFAFDDEKLILSLHLNGQAKGKIKVCDEKGNLFGEKEFSFEGEKEISISLSPTKGKHALLLEYLGEGKFDFYSFSFQTESI